MKGVSGILLIATAAIHFAVGLIEHSEALAGIVRDGVLATIGGEPSRVAVLWFFFFGFVLMFLGQIFWWLERRVGRRPPAFLGWQLAAAASLGAALMPLAGFWLVIPQGVYIALSARKP